ncbi:hypothetical protein E1B28_005965 [Marasmius oreades]|uniref:Protein CPL1-like domain-containing protein n=1 Tax=Marasmius oreades TaxID=181124 RepID=A0A9P7S4I5_9AGAR|nr:uncharacterized protein E1B28_005965 [Marasmius oreades]KAG7095187.1 hypothetical protein E1B28_005965 [Marasmius oreades]
MEVCGVPSAKSGNAFECIDTTSNTDSCGGCVYPNPWAVTSSGKDCTSPKALKVTCRASRCVVDLCQEGFEPNGPREACVPTSLKRHAFRRASVSVPTTIDLGHNNGVTTDLGSNFNGKLNEVGERPATSMMNPIGSMLAGDGSLSCLFSPPHIPDDPPSTLSGLLVLFGNISAIARTVGDFGELLGIECNCHNPAASHPSAPLLKSVVDLVLRVNINLNLLTNPADIDTVADLLNQILKASLRCLELSHLEYALRGILSQLEGQVYQLLKGIKLVPEGISNCDCETDLVSSLRTGSGLKKRSALRRGVACAEADETASFSLLKTKRSLISLDLTPLVPDGDGILDAGAILDHLNYFSEPGFGDTSAPVDIDLNCLGLNGVNDEVIADLGNGMNKPLNEVLAVLAPFVHPGELHPCIKPKPCNGSASGSESDSDSGSHGPPPSKTSSELGSSKGNPESSRLCPPGSTLKGDFTAPVDVDLSCLGLNGVNGEAIVNLGTGLNKPLNEVLDILSPMLHPANVHPCIKPTPCYGGGGSASEPKSSPGTPSIPGTPSGGTLPPQSEGEHRPGSGSGCSSASLLTSVPTASPPTGGSASDSTSPPTGSSGSDPESSGSCTSDDDPTAAVDIDLDCLRINGINGEIIANLGSGLNRPLNEVLDVLSPVVHPCIKPEPCHGRGSASAPITSPAIPSTSESSSGKSTASTQAPHSGRGHESWSGSQPSSPCLSSSVPAASRPPSTVPVTTPAPSKTGFPSGKGGSTCQKCLGSSTSGDWSHAVGIDLNCIGINTVVTVDLGPQVNKLLNGLLDDTLNPIVHAVPSLRSEFVNAEVLKTTLNESVGVVSSMTDAAKVFYETCGCKDIPGSKALLTIAVTAKLKTSLDKLQVNSTVESASAALNAAHGVLAAAKSCETLPGLEVHLAMLIGNCQELIPRLERLLDGLATCDCGKELSATPRLIKKRRGY